MHVGGYLVVVASAMASFAMSSPVAAVTTRTTTTTKTTATKTSGTTSTASASSHVNFTPFKYVGCRQSRNPKVSDMATSYNLTRANPGCYTPPYSFASFVDLVQGDGPAGCSLALWSSVECAGNATAVDLTRQGCQTGGSGPTSGSSFSWMCS